ncbi:hypothetical protein EK21DRAFT_62732 [Setomelanomma holmii]|uniref:PHD-type domain-containing protein n=1 Tax=Setomelanomma holmii TaxID=210430 RepID=A0A9P4HCD6_9PLEO|nr:hypothetical protein EK21DRAFT_62732 [Setomelanomma holmii]
MAPSLSGTSACNSHHPGATTVARQVIAISHYACRALAVALILFSNCIDAWLESLTRASSVSYHNDSPRCAMAEAEEPQPAANPDAQTTVNDFLDYTEFFPSDLVRSLTLIGNLDATYRDAVQQVHELTAEYGQLPTLPEQERRDPVLLRKQISQYLQKAISQREYAFTEASRLYEVTVRHCQRSSIIKRKLQAQPQPPSRDPTPPPVSPQAQRALHRTYERTPHLRLTFDGGRHGASAARPRDRHRKPGQLPSRRPRAHSASSDSSDGSDTRSNIDLITSPRKIKQRRDRHRDRHGPPARARPPGVLGTNVHSSIAGISTSNALAQLAPPPPDAQPGSKWAPWLKLTEYEMAVLRKQMKKNAVWTPSLTMVNRELERKHRTQADYDREKQRCEETGEEMLDEEPESLQQLMNNSGLGQLAQVGPVADPAEPAREEPREDGGTISIRLKPPEAQDGRKLDRLSQRQQAMRDAQELENVSSKLQQAAENMKEAMTAPGVATPLSQKKKSASRPSNKRKRDNTPPAATEETLDTLREASVATQDSGTRQPEPKRPRLQLQLKATSYNDTASPAPTAVYATRPRSARGHVPTPKAQSEEPKPNDIARIAHESRRHSIFSQSALTAPPPTRMSTRRKPPPKGEVTAAEDGQKTVTNVKRSQGSKNKKKKKAEEEPEPVDDIDPDEPRYCICDDVSYGPMISCDNNVSIQVHTSDVATNKPQCDKEWFHMPCVNMTEADIPSRRSKWYCPDCRAALGVDAYGNPLVPPPLPGRRGNR